MFCPNCGKVIDDKAVICPYCGVATGKNQVSESSSNTLAIVGFIFSFFIPIVGLICSIIGIKKSTTLNGKGKGLAVAGIIISVISIVISIIFMNTLMAEIMAESGL